MCIKKLKKFGEWKFQLNESEKSKKIALKQCILTAKRSGENISIFFGNSVWPTKFSVTRCALIKKFRSAPKNNLKKNLF